MVILTLKVETDVTDLVSELQAKALDPTTSVTDLLRIAKVVAVKLSLDEFLLWINSELGGYKDLELPAYSYERLDAEAVKSWWAFRSR